MKENWEIHWKDYYKILQVHPMAEQEAIEAVFRKLAGKYHPDHYNGLDADQRMKDLIEAHEILGNLLKRATYDIRYNQKEIFISSPPKQEMRTNPNVVHEAAQSKWQNVIQSIWCDKCKRKTDMLIAFVDKKPSYGRCPICNTLWNLKAYFDSQVKPNTNPRPYPKREE